MKIFSIISIFLCVLFLFSACTEPSVTTVPFSTATSEASETLTTDIFTSTPSTDITSIPTLSDTTESSTPTPTVSEAPHISARKDGDGGTIAVWWWNKGLATKIMRERYLEFLALNQVNQIYICWSDIDVKYLSDFVLAAKEYGISVGLLSGDASWILPDNNGATEVAYEYLEYQKAAPAGAKLNCLHLDVEPHQLPEFSSNEETKQELIQNYADLVSNISKMVRAYHETIEWDIPFWFDEFEVIIDGEKTPLLNHLAKEANCLTLMSYRDTASAVIECSELELSLGKQYDCKIICGVETHSSEGDHVSFMEEGKEYMYEQIDDLYKRLCTEMDGKNYGVAIHYLDTWYKLHD